LAPQIGGCRISDVDVAREILITIGVRGARETWGGKRQTLIWPALEPYLQVQYGPTARRRVGVLR
jgi:hypothetical protein